MRPDTKQEEGILGKKKTALEKHKLDYEDIPFKLPGAKTARISTKTTRKGGKRRKMSKDTTPSKPKRYNKSQGEHIKDIVIAVLVASIIAFMLGMRFENSQNNEVQSAVSEMQTVTAEAVEEQPVKK